MPAPWTEPKTWDALTKLRAAELNEQVRDNLKHIGPDSGTFQREVALDIRRYGATPGDGSSDLQAVNDALADLTTQGRSGAIGSVVITGGDYRIDGVIDLADDQHIWLAADARIVLPNGYTGDVFRFTGQRSSVDGWGYIVEEGTEVQDWTLFHFDGSGGNGVSHNVAGPVFGNLPGTLFHFEDGKDDPGFVFGNWARGTRAYHPVICWDFTRGDNQIQRNTFVGVDIQARNNDTTHVLRNWAGVANMFLNCQVFDTGADTIQELTTVAKRTFIIGGKGMTDAAYNDQGDGTLVMDDDRLELNGGPSRPANLSSGDSVNVSGSAVDVNGSDSLTVQSAEHRDITSPGSGTEQVILLIPIDDSVSKRLYGVIRGHRDSSSSAPTQMELHVSAGVSDGNSEAFAHVTKFGDLNSAISTRRLIECTYNSKTWVGIELSGTTGFVYPDVMGFVGWLDQADPPQIVALADVSNVVSHTPHGTYANGTSILTGTGEKPWKELAALTASDTSTVDTTYGQEEADVINNLRQRLNEVESRLSTFGLLP